MNINITSRNYTVSDKFKDILTEKIGRLDRYLQDTANAKVICSKDGKDNYKLELTIRDKGVLFRSEVVSDNMFQNIDLALPKVERQINKYSDKLQDKLRKGAKELEMLFNDDFDWEIKPEECNVSKIKNFPIAPLNRNEAIMELENSDHDFYVFLNEEGKVNIIYKRNEGDYGIIDPEY